MTQVARTMRINDLKDRVARSDYLIDADLVAEALLRHTHMRPSLLGALGVSPRGARTPSPAARLPHRGS